MEGIVTLAGCMPRIGTTTLALQLCRYIKDFSDYSPAYVECGAHNYIWSASEMYRSTKEDRTGGHMSIEGIDMYEVERLPELTAGGADIDFLICDYGDITSKNFDREGFSKTTARILIGGVKPNEIHYTEMALKDDGLSSSDMIFTFVPEGDREELKNMMGAKAADTFFIPYAPDPFSKISKDGEIFFGELIPHILKRIGG